MYQTLATGRVTKPRLDLIIEALLASCRRLGPDTKKLALDVMANISNHHILKSDDIVKLRQTIDCNDTVGLATFDLLVTHLDHQYPAVMTPDILDGADYRCLSRLVFAGITFNADIPSIAQDTCFNMQRCSFEEAYHGLQCLVFFEQTRKLPLIDAFVRSALRYLTDIGKIYPSAILQWERSVLMRIIRRRRTGSSI